MKLLICLSLACLSLAACGKKEKFEYELTENGCSTGKKETDSKDKMCSLLKDDGANNGCAYSLRKQKYEGDGCGSWSS